MYRRSIRHTYCGLLAFGAFTIGMVAMWSSAWAQEIPGRDITADRLIESIRENYDRIKTAQLSIKEATRRPGLREAKVVIDRGQGAIAKMELGPLRERTYEVCFRGNQVRRTDVDADGDTWIRADWLWAHYTPATQTAALYRTEQMPGIPPIDPREIGTLAATHSLLEQLRNSTILDVQEDKDNDGRTFYDISLRQNNGQPGRQYRCRFDASRNFLPVQFVYVYPNVGEAVKIEVGYEEVLPHTWLMSHSITTYLKSGQVTEHHIIGDAVINEGVDDKQFAFDFPNGTRVSDSARGEIYVVGNVRPVRLPVFREIGNDPTLDTIELKGASRAEIEAAWDRLDTAPNVRRVFLGGAKVRDADLVALKRLPRLQELHVEYTDITDEGLLHLGELAKLEVLSLRVPQITDAGMKYIAKLGRLRRLDLRGTKVTDASIPHLSKLTQLGEIDIKHTGISQSGFDRLQRQLPECAVVWRDE